MRLRAKRGSRSSSANTGSAGSSTSRLSASATRRPGRASRGTSPLRRRSRPGRPGAAPFPRRRRCAGRASRCRRRRRRSRASGRRAGTRRRRAARAANRAWRASSVRLLTRGGRNIGRLAITPSRTPARAAHPIACPCRFLSLPPALYAPRAGRKLRWINFFRARGTIGLISGQRPGSCAGLFQVKDRGSRRRVLCSDSNSLRDAPDAGHAVDSRQGGARRSCRAVWASASRRIASPGPWRARAASARSRASTCAGIIPT